MDAVAIEQLVQRCEQARADGRFRASLAIIAEYQTDLSENDTRPARME
jgi:hypothetical protein